MLIRWTLLAIFLMRGSNCTKEINCICQWVKLDFYTPFRSQAAIFEEGNEAPFCGGSVITRRHIVTAAQCFPDITRRNNPRNIYVLLGAQTDYKDPLQGDNYEVRDIIRHEGYTGINTTFINDIALLVMKKLMDQSYTLDIACLNILNVMNYGIHGYASGWGKDHGLHQDKVYVDHRTSCQIVGQSIENDPGKMCIKRSYELDDTCFEDLGGPVTMQFEDGTTYLSGIMTQGDFCRESAVYTSISYYIDWLAENTQNQTRQCVPLIRPIEVSSGRILSNNGTEHRASENVTSKTPTEQNKFPVYEKLVS